MHRSNVQVLTAEEYYRITIYNEFLSHAIAELQERFLENSPHAIGLLHLLPSQCCSGEVEAEIPEVLSQAAEFYQHDLPHAVMFESGSSMMAQSSLRNLWMFYALVKSHSSPTYGYCFNSL